MTHLARAFNLAFELAHLAEELGIDGLGGLWGGWDVQGDELALEELWNACNSSGTTSLDLLRLKERIVGTSKQPTK